VAALYEQSVPEATTYSPNFAEPAPSHENTDSRGTVAWTVGTKGRFEEKVIRMTQAPHCAVRATARAVHQAEVKQPGMLMRLLVTGAKEFSIPQRKWR
jgi:hypothetical protein